MVGAAIAFLLTGLIIASLIVARYLFPILADGIVKVLIVLVYLTIPLLLIGGSFFLLRYSKRYIAVEQFGGYLVTLLGKIKPLPPLAPVGSIPGSTKVTEIKTTIPRLGELVTQGLLTRQGIDGLEMLMGFTQDEQPRYELLPGVIAITGMQDVGKSVTMLMLIIIALIQGAHIVVCDTHHTKARSLYKKIAALHGMLTIATTEEEVLQETKNFSAELHARKQGSNPFPYVIFYDEFCSLIRARNQELRETLPVTMEEASQEGQGYGLHLVAAMHDISNSGIGDARLRSFFNWVFYHRMEAGQSKFIEAFNTRKTKQVIASLPKGHVMVRDTVNEAQYLIVPFGDSKDAGIARKQIDSLQAPVMQRQIAQPVNTLTQAHITKPLKEQIAFSYAEMEPLQPLKQPILDGDRLTVYNAVKELKAQGMNVTSRTIGELTNMGKDKANALLNQLAQEGMLTR